METHRSLAYSLLFNDSLSQSCGTSLAIWNHTLLHAT